MIGEPDRRAPDLPVPPEPAAAPAGLPPAPPPPGLTRRPLVERIGMFLIAAALATLFVAVGAISFASGEPFLGVMASIGAAMTAWAGLRTLLRG